MKIPRHVRTAMAALALSAGLALVGCDDSAAAPDSPTVLEVVPAGPIHLSIGDTLRLDVALRNGTGAVAFSSSAPAVVAVSGTGTLSAVGIGAATVTIRSVAEPDVTGSVEVRVVAAGSGGTGGFSALTIESIVNAAGSFVDPARVSGMVVVRLSVIHASATRAEVLLDDTVVCAQALQPGSATPVQLACPFNTVRFDSVTGVPTFANGPHALRARLLAANDSVLASATGDPLVLANTSTLAVRVAGDRAARDSLGLEWVAGRVTALVLPVLYEPGTTVRLVRARYAERDLVVADSAAPFVLTFSAESLRGLTDADFELQVSSTTSGGSRGPQVDSSAAVRYDSEPPAPGTFLVRDWVGREVAFGSLYRRTARADGGVGGATTRFFAGSPSASADELVRSGMEVRAGGDLLDSGAGAYKLAAFQCDALLNCIAAEGFTFGVDLIPPTVVRTSLPDLAVNPAAGMSVTIQDDGNGSGFPTYPLLVAVRALQPGADGVKCGPVVGGLDLPGRAAGNACLPDSSGVELGVPASGAGFFRYEIAAVDRAGNRSETVRRTVVVDREAPRVSGLSVLELRADDEIAVLGATAQDNLDLASMSFRFVFPALPGVGALSLPFDPAIALGSVSDDRLVATASVRDTVTLIRSLTVGGAAAARIMVLAGAVELVVADFAGQTAAARIAVPGTVPITANLFGAIATQTLAVSRNLVCTAGCLGGDSSRSTLTLRLVGVAGFNNPAVRVHFFQRTPEGEATLIGTTTQGPTSDVGTQRTVTYTMAYDPAEIVDAEYTVFAVAVDSNGNALKSPDASVKLFTRP